MGGGESFQPVTPASKVCLWVLVCLSTAILKTRLSKNSVYPAP